MSQADILKKKISQFSNRETLVNDYLPFSHPNLFNMVWDQRKFSNGQSVTSLFFVAIVDNCVNIHNADSSKSWILYPVFRCLHCVDTNYSSANCCVTYVSPFGSSCGDWNHFVKSHYFPLGIMVAPDNGIYKLIDGKVQLHIGRMTKVSLRDYNKFCITSESLAKPPQENIECPVHWPKIDPMKLFFPVRDVEVEPSQENKDRLVARPKYALKPFFGHVRCRLQTPNCSCENIIYHVLQKRAGKRQFNKFSNELSESLVVFTHSLRNFRLASSMVAKGIYGPILAKRIESVFEKVSQEIKSIESRADIIRLVCDVASKQKLDYLFQTAAGKNTRGLPLLNKLMYAPVDILQLTTVKVQGEDINLEDYGSVLKEHILNPESFEDLILSMSENLQPEMFKLILKLTQTFVETIRGELMKQLKYHFSTESVLYNIILVILKHHSDFDCKKVEEQSSEILRRVRYYFASCGPNPFPELGQKCPKCIGFFHIANRD
ncbi:hypothetical protein KR009_002738 [Drosophila setifemur]|nr:hypothetical protein KR009_002738 [Drosophila setifemur]